MKEQQTLGTRFQRPVEKVEEYKFEPIKGYPMLHWKGKRPFESTQFYPAQLKESYGSEANGWFNRIYWGDNLQVMSHLLKEFRGSIDLIYIDPPFDSKADYKKKIQLRGKAVDNDLNAFEEKQYKDIWTNDEYLQFMYERLILMRELLNDNGSFYLHCDWHKIHHLRCVLDEVFGANNFVNHIIWKRRTNTIKGISKSYSTNTDHILFYVKGRDYLFNSQFEEYGEGYEERFKHEDERGKYRWQVMATYSQERLESLKREGRLRFSENAKYPEFKQYLEELKGRPVQDIWLDINMINAMGTERVDYPTQKPEALLERIIKASSKEGDIVFDCFMGSGTTQAVAIKLGRRFIGADINLGAIQTTTVRLIGVAKDLQQSKRKLDFESNETKAENFYTGFQVYNVNYYDFFRNELEAKDLIIKALEIQPVTNSIYDGEKDGRLVKIMPVNRIATRAELNELITNFDQRTFKKRQEENPGKPVEYLLLVCMGHEPDLAAHLQNEMKPYKLDVEVVDILRDKSELELKRDSEAEVVKEKGKVVIKQFYPMNLLQKLSLEKQNVDVWKELVDSIMIDFNYDGAVFEPTLIDIPEGGELVKGEYMVPNDAGTIRVKITDLLSESLEISVNG
jgi:site-specific DNA-methyltransferase (adenine-specific)/adenine-specific DNA-methyltransferase